MVDTTHINWEAVVDHAQLKRNRNRSEYAGPCHLCGGKDRFIFWPDENRWWCRRCDERGDLITYVQQRHNKTFAEACAWLRVEAPALASSQQHQPKELETVTRLTQPREYACFDEEWQVRAGYYVKAAHSHLVNGKSAGGRQAYSYMIRRLGYKPTSQHILRWAGIGYNPAPRRAVWSGVEVFAPEGLVIPWHISGRFWNVRHRPLLTKSQNKYTSLAGCGNGLYNADQLAPGVTVVMVESELDALSLMVAAPSWFATGGWVAVATGGTNNARLGRWVMKLSTANKVYTAFDSDMAGYQAHEWWRYSLKSAGVPVVRRKPAPEKDVNDMLCAKRDIPLWLLSGEVA
jgi:hypothetical protein